MEEPIFDSGVGTETAISKLRLIGDGSGIPYFDRSELTSRSAFPKIGPGLEFHYDLLTFISLAAKFSVDFVALEWQPALKRLGGGASSTVQQGQVDANVNLAFKRATINFSCLTESEESNTLRFKSLILELIALELLKDHPNVVNLLGVTWETDKETKEVWPVLLTERSIYGTLSSFLETEEGRALGCEERLKLLADIGSACLAMHKLSIVHGDIKSENVLIFKNERGWMATLIDFGYSCLGTSKHDLVQVIGTRPWQAPESGDQYFSIPDAVRMDVYTFGILVVRTMLTDMMPSTLGKLGKCTSREETERLLQEIEQMTSSDRFIDIVRQALKDCDVIPADSKDSLEELFRLTLRREPRERLEDLADVIPLLGATTNKPLSNSLDIPDLEFFPHEILQIPDHLGDLDDVDYLLRQTLVVNLKNRVEGKQCIKCRANAAHQLGYCYEIGFGVKRDPRESEKWASKAEIWDNGSPAMSETLKKVENKYAANEPKRILEVLGYDTNLPWDPVKLYRDQGRLEEAERAFRTEVEGRTQSIGVSSKSRLNLLETLALILAARNDLTGAEIVCRETVEGSRLAYGEDDDQTTQAQNFLAYVLQLERKYADLEALERALLVKKAKLYHPTDGTTLASRNRLGAALFFQGKFEECLREMQDLTSIRRKLLGPEHTQTLVTERLVPRCLVELGRVQEAEYEQRSVLEREEKVLGAEDDFVLDDRVTLAEILLETENFHEVIRLNETFFDVGKHKKKDGQEPVTWMRIKAIQVRIAIECGAKVDDAKRDLKDAMSSCLQILGTDHVDLARASKALTLTV